ncbi:MAG: isopeptide-forming domain-containing fimbrial protein [Oscillospiraceae bacterium]|nr:isopeptide-forming domain-containing fimbrial protein [Oscillospiraceae bacterium]
MCVAVLPGGVALAAADDKTLTVNASATEVEGETYTTIQDALDYIAAQDDADGWTVTVKAGSYTSFTVATAISNLTITGESGATVDASSAPIEILGDIVTIEGLSFTTTSTSTVWEQPIIKDASSNSGLCYDSMVTIRNCSFSGNGGGYAIWICRMNATIEYCTFEDLQSAIEIVNETTTLYRLDEEPDAGTITISNNIVTHCNFFIHYGVKSGISLVVTNDTVTGWPDKVCASLFAWDGDSITVEDNTFIYAAFGLQNAVNNVTAKDFLDTNTFSYSYAVDDYYNFSTKADYSATYYAPDVDGNTVTWSVSESGAGTMYDTVAAALEGHENDNPLTFTTTDGEGDLVCMGLAYQAIILDYDQNAKTSKPGLEKKILLEDGTEVDQTSASTYDTITFKLKSDVPTGYNDGTTYTLTFHDELDTKVFLLDTDSFEVMIGDTVLTEDQYTLVLAPDETITDGCTFELSIVLTDISGINVDDDIIVTYTAKLTTTYPGAYYNTAWVTYPDNQSEKATVEVDTYGISVFKFDAADYDETSGTYAGLEGAVFALYTDESCNEEYLFGTYTSGDDGYLTISGLAEGTYYLKETEAPNGYVGSSTVIEIVIPDDANADTFWAYANVPNAPVPSTGGTGTAMYTTVGVIILLAAGCVFLFSRKKRESD